MIRRLISAFLLPGLLLLLLLISVSGTVAAPAGQETVSAEAAIETNDGVVEAEPLPQPIQVTIKQRLPITTDLGQLGIATDTISLPISIGLVLDLTIEFLVTDTLTSTVPSTVSITLADDPLNANPISLTLESVTETLVVLVPQPVVASEPVTVTETVTTEVPVTPTVEITATPTVTVSPEVTTTPPITDSPGVTLTPVPTDTPVATNTPTETATPSATATPEATIEPTATPSADITPITATANVTANLRTGPGIEFELAGQVPLGGELEVAGISEDAEWYLLSNATWIFSELVDGTPADVPIATRALIDQVAANAAAQEEAAAGAPEETATEEPVVEQPTPAEAQADPLVPTPTPTPEPQVVEPEAPAPRANVDANLRAGPGTEYEIVGGTITGQALDIIGQNDVGDWYLLSNGGWIADFVINNPPDDAPVVPDDASPFLSGQPAAPVLVPTPVPGQAAEQTQASSAADTGTADTGAEPSGGTLGLAENLYLDEAVTLISRYQATGDAVAQLIANAEANGALLTDDAWRGDISTAVATLQRSGQQIRAIEPPPLFAAAHIDLRSASESFDSVAASLEAGLDEASLAQFQAALAQIDTGNAQLQAAQDKISNVAQ